MADQHVKGAIDTVEGTTKELAGKVTGNRTLEAKGAAQKVAGKVREGVADAQDAVNKANRA